MKYFKLEFETGLSMVVSGKNSLDVIKFYDLATKKNINTRIIELEGEQLAIAVSNNL